MFDLSDSIVLVTGASRGIGEVTVRTLHNMGAAVILHYGQGEAEAREIAADLNSDRIHLVQADLSIPGTARDLWSKAIAWRGNITAVVNNAATMSAAAVGNDWEHWPTAWQQTLQVNLVAVADLCRRISLI
jgi:NAD(P)-dependent dehydrogenase (short-subunit alcohol dehydrogenase family)